MVKLRDYSSAFSRSVFKDIVKFQDFSHLNWLCQHYRRGSTKDMSYFDYLKGIYFELTKEYRCEYVYKNELLGYLIKLFGTKDSSAYNEFHVGNSIVDIALFNGESKSFEIKTEYDTRKRLNKQLGDYKKLFDKCYVVIPYDKENLYKEIDRSTGILTLKRHQGRLILQIVQEAQQNSTFDSDLLMSCLRTNEYESIIQSWYGELPNVSASNMYKECLPLFGQIPSDELKSLFLKEIKKRQPNALIISKAPTFLRQVCLSLNLSTKDMQQLVKQLEEPIR